MKFTLNRDFVLVTRDGPSFGFKKGVPLYVPSKYASLVIAIGAEASEEDAVEVAEVKGQMAREVAADRARIDAIKEAVRKLVDRNNAGDFSAGGKPSKRKVEAIAAVGDVSEDEIAVAFAEVKNEIQTAG